MTECHENVMFHMGGGNDGSECDLWSGWLGGVVCKEMIFICM